MVRILGLGNLHRSEGFAFVIGLILFGLIGLGLFISFLLIGLQGPPKIIPDPTAVSAVRQMVKLDGLAFANSQQLLDDTEYEVLRSNPDLIKVAARFRRERKELAILWTSLLLSDLKKLWRFRRFLVRRGVPGGFGEEIKVLQAFVFSVIFLNLLKLLIRTAGPFVLYRMTRRARLLVERMSYASASLLSRFPPRGWPEVERSWIRSAT